MRFFVVAAGRIKEKSLRAVADDYLGRVRRYARCDEIEVKDDAGLARALPPDALVVALEVNGDQLSSSDLAQRVERWTSRGKGSVAFVIGGAEGIPSELSKKADARLSQAALGAWVGLSRSAVQERLRRLERKNIIAGYTLRLGPIGAAPGARPYLLVKGNGPSHTRAVKRLQSFPEVRVVGTKMLLVMAPRFNRR